MEYKSVPQHIKAISGREVTGIFSVFGNLDVYDDKAWPGAFTKTIQERGKKVFQLWQHDMDSPAIAVITSLREIGRDELPGEILADYPEALGGVEVVREYLDTPRGNEILTGLQAGVPYQMSFAYDAIKYDFEAKPDAKYEWERVRNLREVKLYEVSDVLWGANDATRAAKSALPLPMLLLHLESWLAEAKDGRRNSAEDQARIETIARLAVELGATNVARTEAAEDPKSRAANQALTLERRARAAALSLRLQPRSE